MYRLIYFYIIRLIEKRNPDPKFYAAGFVTIVQIIHVCALLALIKRIFEIQYPVFSEVYLFNKLYLMPLVLVWLIAVHIFYNKRFPVLVKLYSEKKVVTLRNTIIVFSLLLIPLICMILLLKK
jgi:hypothetical protein